MYDPKRISELEAVVRPMRAMCLGVIDIFVTIVVIVVIIKIGLGTVS